MIDKLTNLIHATVQIAKEKDLRKMLILLSNIARKLLDADRCSIFLNDPETEELWTIFAHGVKEIRIPNTTGIAGYVFQSKEPLNIEEAYEDSRFNQKVDQQTGYRTKSILAIPFVDRKQSPIGVFQVINKKTASHFDAQDMELLIHLSLYAASSIENSILYEKLKHAQEDVVFRLSHATGYKDPETKNHIIRVGLYCQLMGREIGWDDDELEIIRLAAPMHDIGKVGIPDMILKKPGKLNEDEFQIMKKHALYGYDILKGGESKLTQTAAIIALEHHEKWNGKGYPHSKKGEEISIHARMTAISDVFDALTSERHYKNAWSFEQTAELLKEESGKHFDPKLVELFLSNLDEIISIKKEFHDEPFQE
ncbi:HD domain-containing protein [bacterium]|nr:HD domain-containing protein [bacterium]